MDKNRIEKVRLKQKDQQYIDSLKSKIEFKEKEFYIIINSEPENYVRERSGQKHFYNPKGNKMKKFNLDCKKFLKEDDISEINNIIENFEYYISINAVYYIPIPKSDSIKEIVLKDLGLIKPSKRPDLDNYDKFLLDSLHNLFYQDDARVVEIHSKKLYSLDSRTEIIIKYSYFKR